MQGTWVWSLGIKIPCAVQRGQKKIFSKYSCSSEAFGWICPSAHLPTSQRTLGLKQEKKNQGVKRRNKPRGGFVGTCGSLFLPLSFLEFHISLGPPWSQECVPQHVMFWGWWQVANDCQWWPAHWWTTHRTLEHVRKPACPAHASWVAIPMKVTEGSGGFWNQKFTRLELVTEFSCPVGSAQSKLSAPKLFLTQLV